MKRFLSVLLALAVAFTFTFGSTMSAFAAPTHTVTAAELNSGYAAAEGALTEKDATKYVSEGSLFTTYAEVEGLYKADSEGNMVIANSIDDADPTGKEYFTKVSYAVPMATWKAALKLAYDDAMDEVIAGTLKTEATTTDYIVLELRDALLDDTYGADSKYAGYAAATQFDAEIAKIASKMEACDTTIYSTTEYTQAKIEAAPLSSYTWAVDGKTYLNAKAVADAQVAYNVKVFKESYLEKYKTVVAGTLGATLDTVMTQYKAALDNLNEDGDYVLSTSILTKTKEQSLEASNNASVAKGITVLEDDIASYLNDEDTEKYSSFTSKTSTTKADVDEAIAAYRTGKTWLNNNGTVYTTADLSYAAMSPFVASVAKVEKWNAKAVELKAKKNDDGSAMYDAETVDATLKAQTEKEYKTHDGDFNPAAITYITAVEKTDYKSIVTIDDTADDVTAITIDNTIDGANNLSKTTFYNLEYAKVAEAVNTYNAAVDAATTATEVKKAQAALKTAIAAIKDKDDVEDLYEDGGALNETFDAERTTLVNYYKYFVTLKTGVTYVPVFTDVTTAVTGDESVSSVATTSLAYWYITKGARTKDEVKALASDAQAAVAAAKTTAELKAEAQAVDTMIIALPATVTADNKDAVAAAVKAYNELSSGYEGYVSKLATLQKDVKALQVAEYTAVETAAKALPSTTKVTIADKAAVNAAYDAAVAYNKTEMYLTAAGMTTTKLYMTTGIVNVAKAIQALELEAVKDAVEALPSTGKVTVENKAAIESVRAAYDAYVAEYVTNYDADKHTAYVTNTLKGYEEKIVAAEIELAAVTPVYTDKDAKAYLFDMKVTATAKKVSKTKAKMTVKADVTELVENGYTVTYKYAVKAPGSKKYVTKKASSTKASYTFTKLKKGKNTFKVTMTIKNAAGEKVGTKTKTKTYTRK